MSVSYITRKTPTLQKTPSEQFAVGLKYESPDLDEGQRIVSCTVTITPTEASGLEVDGNPVIETDIVSQMIKGGVDGNDYYVKFTTVTSVGHVYEDSIFVRVREIQ